MRFGLIAAVVALFAAGVLGNVACGHKLPPLSTPTSPAGVSPQGMPFTAQQVEEATAQGAVMRGWQIVHREPGLVVADISSGGHGARVRIVSDASGWRIEHDQSSPGLRYTQDPVRGPVIHRRYNQWVQSLDAAIRRALYAPAPTAGGYYVVPVQPAPPPPPPEGVQPAEPAQPPPAPAQPAPAPPPAQPAPAQ